MVAYLAQITVIVNIILLLIVDSSRLVTFPFYTMFAVEPAHSTNHMHQDPVLHWQMVLFAQHVQWSNLCLHPYNRPATLTFSKSGQTFKQTKNLDIEQKIWRLATIKFWPLPLSLLLSPLSQISIH